MKIRKMQTAAGGPLKFTPEQIKYFESLLIPKIPGMNNSGRLQLRIEGIQAQLYQLLEKKRKEEEIKSRMEMRPVLKRKATTAEKLRGKKDEYELQPQVVGMSGADPLLSFYVGGVGLNGVGAFAKTGLWNVAKYAPTTQLGNWGRGYFVGNAFKNSFNGSVPKPVISPLTRTRVGDVEIDNPLLAYRLGTNIALDFLSKGKVTLPEELDYGKRIVTTPSGLTFNFGKTFNNPMFALGKLWYGLPEKSGQDLLVTAEPLSLATLRSNPISSVVNGTFDIRNHFGGKAGVRRIMLEPNQLNISNTTAYTWKPGYGYKKIIQEPSTSLKFFERKPSKISEAERLGIPKGERNLPKLRRSSIDFNLKNWRESLNPRISKDIDIVDPVNIKKFGETEQTLANRKYSTQLYLKEKNNRKSSYFSTKSVNDIKQYISLLENADPRFLNDNGLLSFYIRDYRQYLNDLGYKAEDLSDFEIAKLLTDQYNKLTNTQTGKLKGLVVFHSGPRFFDLFDYSMTGTNTGNMGYLGPGNYFSTEPSVYGAIGNYTTQNFVGKYRYPRRLPYLITNIKSTPVSKELKKTGIVPEYTSPPKEVYTDDIAKLNYIQNYIKPLIDNTKPRNMAILDDISIYPHSIYTKGRLIEFNVPRNTGIKSLFPHPSTFIRDANGKIVINRIWEDPRVNYKQGGKMNILEFLKNGSGIHIKPKNRGKFTKYCHGKVTDECIRKAKASGNPTLVKRATFAANARKWKHKEGGKALLNSLDLEK